MFRHSNFSLLLLVSTLAVLAVTSGFITPHCTKRNRVSTPVRLYRSDNLMVSDHSPPTNRATAKNLIPKITEIESLEDFENFLKEDDRLCVVKFHAAWCKSCQKFGVQFRHFAMEEADKIDKKGSVQQEGRVRFASIEFGQNSKLCRSLEIKKLPTVQFYKAPMGLIKGFPCGPKKFALVEETLTSYLTMSQEELEFEMDLSAGVGLMESIDLKQETVEVTTQEKKEPEQKWFELF